MTRRIAVFGTSLTLGAIGLLLSLPGCIPITPKTPKANSQVVTVAAGGTVNITTTATGGSGSYTWTLVSGPSHGTLVAPAVLPNVTYQPTAGYEGCDGFVFRVNDGTYNSNDATVTISVANKKPVAQDVTATATAGQNTTVTMAGTDPDNCPLPLTFQIVTPPQHGTVGTPSGANVTYKSTATFAGTDTFTYKAFDGLALSDNIGTATITVGVNPGNRRLLLTLRNKLTDRYIHYHLILIAFVEDITPGDEARYLNFGYHHYPSGTTIGCYTFTQNLYLYYHNNGKFRSDVSNPTSTMLSGIAPASSSSTPRVDSFFGNREVPLPSVILFHDPGTTVPSPFNTGRGSSTINPGLHTISSCVSCDRCAQAGWYYVQSNDTPIGIASACTIGRDITAKGRYYRVPGEIQGTVCYDCTSEAGTLPIAILNTAHWLHNSAAGTGTGPLGPGLPTDVRCHEFYADSVIVYTFGNAADAVQPGGTATPSLVWDVRSRNGDVIHLPS